MITVQPPKCHLLRGESASNFRSWAIRSSHVEAPRRSYLRRSGLLSATAAPYAQPYTPTDASPAPRKAVVIGAGWAGFGAAKHLASQGYRVTLLDGSPNPGGLSAGWRTPQGRSVEAGVKGFWYQYRNIFSLVNELNLTDVFTRWTPSGFWSPQGLTTQAPVFSELPRYPTMLGQFVHTVNLFEKLPVADRVTMVPLLGALLDYDSDPETYARYDAMTARELFRQYGVSKRLYEEFLKPLLLVALFAPPEDLSAGAVLGAFYFYTLAHQADFDVCWARGSVAEKIFEPLIASIERMGGQIQGSSLVTDVHLDDTNGHVTGVTTKNREGKATRHEADAVVFAIGISGMQKLVQACPVLAGRREFQNIMNLKGLDVIATRLWYDRRVAMRFPANVLSGFDATMGQTFFDLNDLQDEYRDAPGQVIASDFYHSNTLMPLSDDEIVHRATRNIAACEPGFASAQVVDAAVLKFKGAVTHFSPGSYPSRPTQQTSFPNLFIAGDWVRGLKHGANGLSQERAYVTGLVAANMVVQHTGQGVPAMVLDVEEDEAHIVVGRQLNRLAKSIGSTLGIRNPFLF